MKRVGRGVVALGVVGLVCVLVCGCAARRTVGFGERTITGPFTHRNLAVFVIRGRDRVSGKTFLTFDEGMRQKKLCVYETGNVGQLQVENRSRDEYIYIQSGEIVKGGKQDRTLRYDYIVPPRSGKLPLMSFCVERGRWARRGAESTTTFKAGKYLPTGASRGNNVVWTGSNAVTWSEVSRAQVSYGRNIGKLVTDGDSPSSLQLTLEHKAVRATAGEYTAAVAKVFDRYEDAVGFAYAINGEVYWADVYASSGLFKRLRGKLLEASSQEAIIEFRKGTPPAAPTAGAVQVFMARARAAKATERKISATLRMVVRESPNTVYFKAIAGAEGGEMLSIHEGYGRKVGTPQRPRANAGDSSLAPRHGGRANELFRDGAMWTPDAGD